MSIESHIPVIEIATDKTVRLSEIPARRFYISTTPRDPNKPYVRARFERKIEPETKTKIFKRWLYRLWWKITHRKKTDMQIRETRYHIVYQAQKRAKEAIQKGEDRKIFALLNNEL